MNSEIEYLLGQILDIASTENCPAVIVAGDIYDRSNPSPDSVAIFDGFVTSLAERGIHTFIVSGNHDSQERISYASFVLEGAGIHISPVFDGNIMKTTLSDEFGDVNFYLMPFFRPSQLKAVDSGFTGDDFTSAHRHLIDSLEVDEKSRNIAVAHQFAAGGRDEGDAYDSEAGGSGLVLADVFEKFDYTALGHLHKAHSVINGSGIEYCGSPLKCSFSEANDKKSVNVIELAEKGSVKIVRIPLIQKRDLREIRGSYEYVTSLECRGLGNTEDYLRIVLTDEDDIPDAVSKLRTIYPNLMRLAYDNRRTRESQIVDVTSDEDDIITPESVFAELYELQNNATPSDETMKIVRELFEQSAKGEE